MNDRNALRHYGKLGMKWGVIKKKESDYKERMVKLSKTRDAKLNSDSARFKYRADPLAVRAGKIAKDIVAQTIIKDVLFGALTGKSQLLSMNKFQALDMVKKMAVSTATKVAMNDALAYSASRKYNKEGTAREGRVKGKPPSAITREDMMVAGMMVASKLAPYAQALGKMKLEQVLKDRRANKERVDKWGANLLPEKVDNVVWQSDDLSYSVIDTGAPKGWH